MGHRVPLIYRQFISHQIEDYGVRLLDDLAKLIKLGLTAEQVAEAVDLPLNEVQQLME